MQPDTRSATPVVRSLADRMRAQGDTVQAHSIGEESSRGRGGRDRSAA